MKNDPTPKNAFTLLITDGVLTIPQLAEGVVGRFKRLQNAGITVLSLFLKEASAKPARLQRGSEYLQKVTSPVTVGSRYKLYESLSGLHEELTEGGKYIFEIDSDQRLEDVMISIKSVIL